MPDKKIFISYSHRDEIWKDRLSVHLRSLKRSLKLSVWSDRNIKGGADWENEILSELHSCHLAILIISAEFLASDFIQTKELPSLLQRYENEEVIIYPIIAEDCVWKEHGWLAQMQARPRDGRPLSADKNQINTNLKAITSEISKLLFPEEQNVVPIPAAASVAKQKFSAIDCKLLPYLANRDEQENALVLKLRPLIQSSATCPLVCFVHGDECQSHKMFIERLRYSLPMHLHALETDAAPLVIRFAWPKHYTDFPDFCNRVLSELDRYVSQQSDLDFTIEAYGQVINQKYKRPIIISTSVSTQTLQNDFERHIEYFLKLWQRWPARGRGQALIAAMVIRYLADENPPQNFLHKIFTSPKPSTALNQQIKAVVENTSFSACDNITGAALPELLGISRDEAQNWAERKEVERVCGKNDLTPDIRAIYATPGIVDDNDRIAMETLAKELQEKVIDKYNP